MINSEKEILKKVLIRWVKRVKRALDNKVIIVYGEHPQELKLLRDLLLEKIPNSCFQDKIDKLDKTCEIAIFYIEKQRDIKKIFSLKDVYKNLIVLFPRASCPIKNAYRILFSLSDEDLNTLLEQTANYFFEKYRNRYKRIFIKDLIFFAKKYELITDYDTYTKILTLARTLIENISENYIQVNQKILDLINEIKVITITNSLSLILENTELNKNKISIKIRNTSTNQINLAISTNRNSYFKTKCDGFLFINRNSLLEYCDEDSDLTCYSYRISKLKPILTLDSEIIRILPELKKQHLSEIFHSIIDSTISRLKLFIALATIKNCENLENKQTIILTLLIAYSIICTKTTEKNIETLTSLISDAYQIKPKKARNIILGILESIKRSSTTQIDLQEFIEIIRRELEFRVSML